MKKISILPFLTLTALVSVTGISGAHAQLITEVDSRGAFDLVTTGQSINDLESIVIDQNANGSHGFYNFYGAGSTNGISLTNEGETFTINDQTNVNTAFYALQANTFGASDGSQYIDVASGLTITGLGTNAVGFDIFSENAANPAGSVTVTDSLGNTYQNSLVSVPLNQSNSPDGNAFIGFIDANEGAIITSISFTGGAIDNITTASVAAVPEPGTYAMLLGGLSALVLFRIARKSHYSGNC